MTLPDLPRIINSDVIQSVLRAAKQKSRRAPIKKNPLRNVNVLMRLNPHAKTVRRAALLAKKKPAKK